MSTTCPTCRGTGRIESDVDYVKNLVGQTPARVTGEVIRRMEERHHIPHGSIMSKERTMVISRARYDAIAEVWAHFNSCGKRLTIIRIAQLFDLHVSTVWTALVKRGLVNGNKKLEGTTHKGSP